MAKKQLAKEFFCYGFPKSQNDDFREHLFDRQENPIPCCGCIFPCKEDVLMAKKSIREGAVYWILYLVYQTSEGGKTVYIYM